MSATVHLTLQTLPSYHHIWHTKWSFCTILTTISMTTITKSANRHFKIKCCEKNAPRKIWLKKAVFELRKDFMTSGYKNNFFKRHQLN